MSIRRYLEDGDRMYWFPRGHGGLGQSRGGFGKASITHLESQVDPTDQTTYTFSDVSFGTESQLRKIFLGVGFRGGTGTGRTITSLTVGGVAASNVVEIGSGGGDSLTAMYQAEVPTGTSGDIVVTLSGAALRCGVDVYRVIGTVASTDTSVAEPLTATLDVPKGGGAIAYAFAADFDAGVPTATWTGLTENTDEAIEGSVVHSSASDVITAGGSTEITCTWSEAISAGTGGVFVAFRI